MAIIHFASDKFQPLFHVLLRLGALLLDEYRADQLEYVGRCVCRDALDFLWQ